ncbi:accessory gene regulator B family protein [Clostridium sp.]|uniref:accessory gene regulator B family protein n=1 Tax=Clostridium sp. TaxID=1506 RepID=UPI003F2EC498
MVKKLIDKTINNLAIHNNYTEVQTEQTKYVLTLITYEFIKLALSLFIFSLFGYFAESVLIIVFMSLTKPFTGGYHEDSQIRCFIATLLIMLFIIVLYKTNDLSFIGYIILAFLSIFAVYNISPVIDSRMPLTKKEFIQRNKLIGTFNTLAFLLIGLILFNIKFVSQIIIWTSVVQAMLLFNKYKK